jgi:REP element-mobilizing transposase RayT
MPDRKLMWMMRSVAAFCNFLEPWWSDITGAAMPYCLIPNHYYLLIETPHGLLSAGMRQLKVVYTQRFNRCHDRVGYVFQGRFKATVVERDTYLLELCRYLVLNPVLVRC